MNNNRCWTSIDLTNKQESKVMIDGSQGDTTIHNVKDTTYIPSESKSYTDTVDSDIVYSETAVGGDRGHTERLQADTSGLDTRWCSVFPDTQDKYDLALRFKAKTKIKLKKQKLHRFSNVGLAKEVVNLVNLHTTSRSNCIKWE